jgi:hypothetical protein
MAVPSSINLIISLQAKMKIMKMMIKAQEKMCRSTRISVVSETDTCRRLARVKTSIYLMKMPSAALILEIS